MTNTTKKILIWGGGAAIIGAVGFFIWSFFQKDEIAVDNTTVKFGTEEEPTTTTSNGSIFSQYPTDFGSIEAPNIFSDLESMFKK